MPHISFPRYSFIQEARAGSGSCYTDPSLCLPLSSNHNLSFYAVMVDAPTARINDLLSTGPYVEAVTYLAVVPADFSGDGVCTTLIQENTDLQQTNLPMLPFVNFITASYTDYTEILGVGFTAAYFDLPNGVDFASLPVNDNVGYVSAGANFAPQVGECFKFLLITDVIFHDPDPPHDNTIIYRYIAGCTTCFIRTASLDCFSSLVSYTNDENAFDFTYQIPTGTTPVQVVNKLELPIYLRDPVMNDDAKVYTRSDGSITKLYERKEEQYTLETDLMPYTWIKALDIALSHDTVSIQNSNITAFDSINTAQNFQKKDSMEIEYTKGPFTAFGKATCKLLNANPVHLYNNNCG